METPIENNWHVDTGESVLETDAETLKQWIREGSVFPHHRLSRGGLRWLEAGKVPQFAEHFATAHEMKELLSSDIPPAKTPLTREGTHLSQNDDQFVLPSEKIAAAQTPFGIKLMASSAVALILALLGGYLWAYHVSSARDFASLKNEPKMFELQTKLDGDKAVIEAFRNSKPAYQPPVAGAYAPGLGPAKTGDFADRKFGSPGNMPTYTTPRIPDPSAMMPKSDYDGMLKNLDAQFETDKKKIVGDIRAADSKSRFPLAAFALFMGLGGLNFVRLKLFSKK